MIIIIIIQELHAGKQHILEYILIISVDWWFRSCGPKSFDGYYVNPIDFIGIWSEYSYDLPHGKWVLEYIGTLVVEILSMDWVFWHAI